MVIFYQNCKKWLCWDGVSTRGVEKAWTTFFVITRTWLTWRGAPSLRRKHFLSAMLCCFFMVFFVYFYGDFSMFDLHSNQKFAELHAHARAYAMSRYLYPQPHHPNPIIDTSSKFWKHILLLMRIWTGNFRGWRREIRRERSFYLEEDGLGINRSNRPCL